MGSPGLDPAVLGLPSSGSRCFGLYSRAMSKALSTFDRPKALTEIQERNRLRKSASLPRLDIEGELKPEGGGR